MPSDHKVWEAIEEYLKLKSDSLENNIQSVNSLEYLKISEEVIKKTGCDKTKFNQVFDKMQKEGEIKSQEKNIKIYFPKDVELKFGKPDNDYVLQWFIGLYFMLVVISVFVPTANAVQAIGLLILGSFTMFVGNKIIVFRNILNQKAVRFGEKYYFPIRIVNWFVFFLILFSSAYLLFSLIFLQKIEVNSQLILQTIIAGVAASISVVIGLQKFTKQKE